MSRNALPPARRPSEAALDALLDLGTSGKGGNSDDAGHRGTRGTSDVSSNSRNPVPPDTREAPVTSDASVVPGTTGDTSTPDAAGNFGISGTTGKPGALSNLGNEGNPGISTRPVDLREHVKIRRALADEMRDAVWFLSEHGRPRVRLGELLDEAVSDWLDQVKRSHNGGGDFPRKGRLR